MELYKIIADLDQLKEFIDWLPELQVNEKFYVCLFARNKYDPSLKGDKSQLKRFISDKSRLLEKIKQLEIPVGNYTMNGTDITQESLALYINPNPRSMYLATKMMGKRCWDLLASGNYNIHQEALSCIQQSCSRKVYLDFDIDDVDADLSKIKDIGLTYFDLLRTRGGYHLLVDPKKETVFNWYQALQKAYNVDNIGDQLIPVPGTYQGGFVPHFVNV